MLSYMRLSVLRPFAVGNCGVAVNFIGILANVFIRWQFPDSFCKAPAIGGPPCSFASRVSLAFLVLLFHGNALYQRASVTFARETG